MPRIEIAKIVKRWIPSGVSIKRILLPVEIDEFDGEKNGEESEDQKPGQAKPKPIERSQDLIAPHLNAPLQD